MCQAGIPILRVPQYLGGKGHKVGSARAGSLVWRVETIPRLLVFLCPQPNGAALCRGHVTMFALIRPAVSRVNEAAGS